MVEMAWSLSKQCHCRFMAAYRRVHRVLNIQRNNGGIPPSINCNTQSWQMRKVLRRRQNQSPLLGGHIEPLWLYKLHTQQHWPVAGALGARWKPLRTLRVPLQSQRPHGHHRHVRSLATGFGFGVVWEPPKSHGLSSFWIISNRFESFPHVNISILGISYTNNANTQDLKWYHIISYIYIYT